MELHSHVYAEIQRSKAGPVTEQFTAQRGATAKAPAHHGRCPGELSASAWLDPGHLDGAAEVVADQACGLLQQRNDRGLDHVG